MPNPNKVGFVIGALIGGVASSRVISAPKKIADKCQETHSKINFGH
jgi:hypothetical protein